MRIWRNWQTRTAKDRVGDLAGSSPVVRTIKKQTLIRGSVFYHTIEQDSNLGSATVVRQPGELSNRERVEPTEGGGETAPARARRAKQRDSCYPHHKLRPLIRGVLFYHMINSGVEPEKFS